MFRSYLCTPATQHMGGGGTTHRIRLVICPCPPSQQRFPFILRIILCSDEPSWNKQGGDSGWDSKAASVGRWIQGKKPLNKWVWRHHTSRRFPTERRGHGKIWKWKWCDSCATAFKVTRCQPVWAPEGERAPSLNHNIREYLLFIPPVELRIQSHWSCSVSSLPKLFPRL